MFGYSNKQITFSEEFYSLCKKFGYYTNDDEWGPTCFFWSFTSGDDSFLFDVSADDNKLRFLLPIPRDAGELFREEIIEHNRYQKRREEQGHPQMYVNPGVYAYILINESGLNGLVSARLYDKDGASRYIEKVVQVKTLENLPEIVGE